MIPFTLKLEDKIHKALKIRAAQEGKTMQELVNETIKEMLSK